MTPERWRQIQNLYHSARERETADRPAFLAEACGTDTDLRTGVEALLAEDSSRGGAVDPTQASPGSQFGPYRIEASIGKGGMGEVWKARDSRLNRDVAIKISAQQFTGRFEREAQAIAALNHPNICTLYDIGPNYLVMELVDGPTLAARIARGPLPLDEALAIAGQITSALEAAHEKGIVHRDLKPANIKIRPDGSVKVLDFGLATATGSAESSPDSPTMTMTVPGTIMGTPGYMSPEQVRGEKVDKRADIWAFGVVLYEMVAGQRPFSGKTTSDTMAAVMKEDPDWNRAPAKTHRLLKRCLEKEPRLRLRDIGDAMALLDDATPEGTSAPSRSRFAMAGWIAAVIFLLAAAGLAVLHFSQKPPEALVMRLSVTPPEGTHFPGPNGMTLAVSPDGRRLIMSAVTAEGRQQLWLRPFDSMTSRPLPGTEDAAFPFWSPDGKSIGFFAAGKLKKMDIAGGPSTVLADASNARGGTWNQQGVIVFAPTPYELQQIPASGGAARSVYSSGSKSIARRFPWFLPDGTHFLYIYGSTDTDFALRVGSLGPAAETELTLPGVVNSRALYSQGYVLFVRGTTLLATPFDTRHLAYTGEAVPVAERVQVRGLISGEAKLSASANGVLVLRDETAMHLRWFDRTGRSLGTLGEPGDLGESLDPGGVRFSPDHRTIALHARDEADGNVNIWLYDVTRGVRTRFTFDRATPDSIPVWSPDGRTIVFHSNRSGHQDLYRKPVDGSRNEELLYSDSQHKFPSSFSPDGRYLAYQSLDPANAFDIWILPDPLGVPGASKPFQFVRTEFNEQDPQFSPDGHWIAYVSNQSGRNNVFVAPFPGPAGGTKQVSTAGGTQPRWRADGKELFFVAPDSRLMAAQVEARSGDFEVKKVDPLFGPVTNSYDVTADGQRFLALVPPEGEADKPLTVAQNWTIGLKK